jgi:DNA-binding NtrC family response regulator
MTKQLHILIVEDSEDDALFLLRELKRGGHEPVFERIETAEAMKEALDNRTWDVIISDYSMPQFSGLAALNLLKEIGLDIPFIIVSGNIGEDVAVGAMKAGAHDYIMKGNLARLVPAVEREPEADVRRKGGGGKHIAAEPALLSAQKVNEAMCVSVSLKNSMKDMPPCG